MSKSKPIAKTESAVLEMFVLDVLRHDDIEPFASIVRMLNDDGCIGWRDQWPHDFQTGEVQSALEDVIQQGWVEVLHENGAGELAPMDPGTPLKPDGLAEYWFRLTSEGRAVWGEWNPPT